MLEKSFPYPKAKLEYNIMKSLGRKFHYRKQKIEVTW